MPTPVAAELRDRVHELTRDVRVVLTPHVSRLDVASLERTFTIRASEGFVELFAAALVAAVTKVAPRARLRFASKPDKDALPLRDGEIDLEIGVGGTSAPEVRTLLVFRDDFIGAVQHPVRHLLADADAGESLHAWSQAFDVLNVDGAENINLVLQQQQNVFIALGEAAALDIGVRQDSVERSWPSFLASRTLYGLRAIPTWSRLCRVRVSAGQLAVI